MPHFGAAAITSLFFTLASMPCLLLMWLIRPRWLAWTVNGGLLLLLAYFSLAIVNGMSHRLAGWMVLLDLLIFWSLPILIIGLFQTPTRIQPTTPNHCPCGYDLTGNTSGTCPECGRVL